MFDVRRPAPLIWIIVFPILLGCAAMRGSQKIAAPEVPPAPQASAPAEPLAQQEPQAPPVQHPAAHKPQSAPAPQPGGPVSPGRQFVEKGEYQMALDEYGAGHRKHPKDQALLAEYAKGVEEMKSIADKAYEKEDYSSAGRVYNLLLKRYDQFRDFTRMLTFDRTYLSRKLAQCKKGLSVRGFQEYRKGNLTEAILLWQALLALDPNNKDIRKAVATATEQQKTLQTKR